MTPVLSVMVTPFFNTCHRPHTVLRPLGTFFFNFVILLQPLVAETISIPQRRPLKLRDGVNHQTQRARPQTDPGPTLSATPSQGFSVSQSKQKMLLLRRWDKERADFIDFSWEKAGRTQFTCDEQTMQVTI